MSALGICCERHFRIERSAARALSIPIPIDSAISPSVAFSRIKGVTLMFCAKCGAAIPNGNQFCTICGQAVGTATALTQPTSITGTLDASAPPISDPLPDAPTSGKALWSMISGIFGLLFFFPAIAAIVLGHVSRSDIKKSNGRLKGLRMSTAGLVMGYGAFAFLPFILIIAAIAIPNLLRARIAANESTAVHLIRDIDTAEVTYQVTYPEVGYTCHLSALGGKDQGAPGPEHAQILEDSALTGERHGYRFILRNCVNTADEHKYQVIAYPLVRNQSGRRTFCSDESGVIKAGEGESVEDCLEGGERL